MEVKSFRNSNWIKFLLFVVSILLVIFFLPKKKECKISFVEGRPWVQGLLTAPFDFPIYKNEKDLKAEQDSVLLHYFPYYQIDSSIAQQMLKQLSLDYASVLKEKWSEATYGYVKSSLSSLYKAGILGEDVLAELNSKDLSFVHLLDGKESTKSSVSSFKTSKKAYIDIISKVPNEEIKDELKLVKIAEYIKGNIVLNEELSQKTYNDLLSSVSLSKGMVQVGEKIINRGEIITHDTYDVLQSLEKAKEERGDSSNQSFLPLLGKIVLVCLTYLSLLCFLLFFRKELYRNLSYLLFILVQITSFVVLTEILIQYELLSVYAIPYTIFPILTATFFDTRSAFYSYVICILLCSFVIIEDAYWFLLFQLSAGMVAVFSIGYLNKRSQLIRTAVLIFGIYILLYLIKNVIYDGDIRTADLKTIAYFAVNAICLTTTYFHLSLVESFLGFASNVTLMELSNIDSPIFREFAEKCPGSFQHSLQVSNLASMVADEVGANAILARTGALFHDIGKLSAPSYFTENQISAFNPHNNLEYDESARIIISHVSSGLEIADKIGLPNAIKGFIRTHHGRGKAWYFYNSYKNKYPDKEVDEKQFTYPGPNPYSKETAIVMMADAIEAASRSLKEYTEEAFRSLVESLVKKMIDERLLQESPLTFQEIGVAKDLFVGRLKVIYHTRITYPTLKLKDSDAIEEGTTLKNET